MKQYNLTSQQDKNYCVPSCLQAILRKYNFEINQKEIAKDLTPTKQGFFIDDKNVVKFLKKFGFEYMFYLYNETPFNEQDMVLKEDADILVGIANHCFILSGFQDPTLFLLDPKDDFIKKRKLELVLNEMRQSNSGGFGLINKI